jgi:hypothetical protein
VITALMFAFYLHVQNSAQTGAVAGVGQNHPMRLADGDEGDGEGDDSGQGDQDPGDQIQVPEQQEEQQEDGGGPGLMF